ncbi:MAG: AI-2E family transporter [Elusimicrobia bacterium]|nr:AI-2E family transporter [Elusimicrobiota bacterium]
MREILTPFVLALLVTYLINPLISFFENKGYRRRALVAFLYLIAGSGLTLAASQVIPKISHEIPELQASLPQRLQSLKMVTFKTIEKNAKRLPNSKKIIPMLDTKIQEAAGWLLASLPDVASGIASFFSLLILVPFVAFFFLTDGPLIFEWLLRVCPGRHVEKILHVYCAINETLGSYLRALIIECSLIGALTAAGLWWIDLDYWLVLGLLTGLSGFIPYVGPVLVGMAAAGLALAQHGDLSAVLGVLAVFTGVQFIDNWILQPVIMSRSVNLHPAVLLFALMAGGKFFGFLGLILAAPVACIVKVTAQILLEYYMTETGLKKPPKLPLQQTLII